MDGGFGVARDVAARLCAECAGLAVEGVVATDGPPQDRPDQIDVVVAEGVADPLPAVLAADEQRLARSILLTLDRASSATFDGMVERSRGFGARFAGDVATADAMGARWAAAQFLPIGWSAGRDAVATPGDRDLDVVILGPTTDRRRAAASSFAAARPGVRVAGCGPEAGAPGPESVQTQRAALRRARVAVLVHPARADEGTEWYAAVEAILAGVPLVLERPFDLAPLKAGRDVLTASLAALPAVVDEVLADDDLARRLRDAAHALLRGAPPLASAAGALLGAAWELRASTWRAPAA